jgi:hypothetical protein
MFSYILYTQCFDLPNTTNHRSAQLYSIGAALRASDTRSNDGRMQNLN